MYRRLRRSFGVLVVSAAVLLLVITVAALARGIWSVRDEILTSKRQAQRLVLVVEDAGFHVEPGRSDSIHFPDAAPFDARLGYARLPQMVQRLESESYAVTAQSRMSPRLLDLTQQGLFPPYHEKARAGLTITDRSARPLFESRHPRRVYAGFDAIPPVLVSSLLFIENRDLLDADRPMLNPAIDWSRLSRAVGDQMLRAIDPDRSAGGGSTLATQIEKYRHSPEGRTDSPREKLRQMLSASLRAYLDGENTLGRRRDIVLDYLNTVPLAAQNGVGEVNGLGDGLWAWYGRDFAQVNRLLARIDDNPTPTDPVPRRARAFRQVLLAEQGLAFKQALSLMVAQRRPSHYLGHGDSGLDDLTDSHLRVMAQAGVIGPALRDAALSARLERRRQSPPLPDFAESGDDATVFERKAAWAVRARLSAMLGVARNYDLDRLDLQASSTIDGRSQRALSRMLRGLADPKRARAAGLVGQGLLGEGDDPRKIVYSFTLYERGRSANLLRVQTDSLERPLDVNEGVRLDLGSTAKLRTLVTYLELVAELHRRWGGLDRQALARLAIDPRDALGRWAREHLARANDRGLATMLEAAMERRYPARPDEVFFSGGGAHRFGNFDAADNSRVMTVREALVRSVNLVFVRLMRDLVRHLMFEDPDSRAALQDAAAPQRDGVLSRFADREGREFVARFYRKYRMLTAQQAEDLLLQDHKATPVRLAAVFGLLEPTSDAAALADFLRRHLPAGAVSTHVPEDLLARYGPERLTLTDRGYSAGIHPLELWLVGFMRHHPQATLEDAFAASAAQRQEVYAWLRQTRNKAAQDVRILSLLEVQAFLEIHRRWQRLGYPFETITPSYASALGASGDRPAALAELMGIIVAGGVRLPTEHVDSLVFARDTPYETRLEHRPPPGERVLPAEVAAVLRRALTGVVESGTARRVNGVFVRGDGSTLQVGGKTGTGDHRIEADDRHASRVVSRSATFVFLIGERHFGTLMAYVQGPDAASYRFTSALPTQLLRALAPTLMPLVEPQAGPGDGIKPPTP